MTIRTKATTRGRLTGILLILFLSLLVIPLCVADTAKALWRVYVGLNVLCALAFWLAGMSLFDAVGDVHEPHVGGHVEHRRLAGRDQEAVGAGQARPVQQSVDSEARIARWMVPSR